MYYLYHSGILGQKWGVRRYQNKDGTLTPEGKQRYAKDIIDNKYKAKDKRADTSEPNPRRWVSEDLTNQSSIVSSVTNSVNTVSKIEQSTRPKATKKARADLSHLTDQDLQKMVQRERLERQYDELFNPTQEPTISKGRKTVENILEISGTVLALTGSAIAIAKAINDMKGAAVVSDKK